MNRFAKLCRILTEAVRNPRSLGRVLDAEQEMKSYVVRRYGLPRGLPTLEIRDLFPDFSETVRPYSFLEGTSLPIDIALLRALARRVPHCRYFEIGLWRGESAANVAQVADECVALSLSPEDMRSRGLPEAFVRAHGVFTQGLPNVRLVEHDSRTFNYAALGGTFDLVFVDGDHAYEAVKADTRNVFGLLRDERSVIVWHDYGRTTETVRWSVLAGILDGSDESVHGNLYHVSNTLCAVYIRGGFSAAPQEFPRTPGTVFDVRLSAHRWPGDES